MRRSARLPPAGSLVFVPLLFAPRATARAVGDVAVAFCRAAIPGLRRLPMRTIIRRRQLVVAELVGAVAVGEVLVGVGGVNAHDWNRL